MGWRVTLVGLAASLLQACLITDPVDFPRARGHAAGGSCLCAFCWDEEFCGQAGGGPPFIPRPAGGCPEDFPAESLPTNRATELFELEGDFFCISPTERSLEGDDIFCPAEDRRVEREHIAPCIDVPRCARVDDDLYGDCTEHPPEDEPTCEGSHEQVRPLVCTEPGESHDLSVVASVDKLIDACSPFGRDIPDGPEPSRFCFLSCIDGALTGEIGPEGRTEECDPVFDPPGRTPFSIRVPLDPVESTGLVAVAVEGESDEDRFALEGELAVDIPRRCMPPIPEGEIEVCEASIPFLRLRSPGGFTLFDTDVTDIRAVNPVPLEDQVVSLPELSLISLDQGIHLFVRGHVEDAGVRGTTFSTGENLAAVLDWDARELTAFTVLQDDEDNPTSAIGLTLHGAIPSLPPTADAGPDQVLECAGPSGASALLSAAASTDPDGADDLASFSWSWRAEGRMREAGGEDLEIVVPYGTTHFAVAAADRAGSTDLDGVDLTVEDSMPPSIDGVDLATDCLWPPSHRMHLFRLGREIQASASDVCDGGSVAVRIIAVESNQPEDALGDGSTAPDVLFGSAALCIRGERTGTARTPREYTVWLEAEDLAGNVSQEPLVIRVPHDQRPDDRCETGDLALEVADDDPACVAELPEAGFMLGSPAEPARQGRPRPAGGCSVASHAADPVAGFAPLALALVVLGRRRRRR